MHFELIVLSTMQLQRTFKKKEDRCPIHVCQSKPKPEKILESHVERQSPTSKKNVAWLLQRKGGLRQVIPMHQRRRGQRLGAVARRGPRSAVGGVRPRQRAVRCVGADRRAVGAVGPARRAVGRVGPACREPGAAGCPIGGGPGAGEGRPLTYPQVGATKRDVKKCEFEI